jgi:hypothetical protein
VLAAALVDAGVLAAADVDGLLAFFVELLQAAIARAAAMTGTTKRAPFLDMAMTGTAFLWWVCDRQVAGKRCDRQVAGKRCDRQVAGKRCDRQVAGEAASHPSMRRPRWPSNDHRSGSTMRRP